MHAVGRVAGFKTSGLSATKYAKAVDVLENSGRKLGFTDEQTKTALGSLLIASGNMTKASTDLSVAQDGRASGCPRLATRRASAFSTIPAAT